MVHVFIVDENTFKYHLEYMFAGIGVNKTDYASKTKQGVKTPFLKDDKVYLHHSIERNLVGMIADISRIRIGDLVSFYVQKTTCFYGFFRVKKTAFFDENDDNNYLRTKLQIGLSYRVLIEPAEVFAKGVTEHQLLDSLDGINKVSDMCWSLIYRKLKGNRGCTMITDKEYSFLRKKLQAINSDTLFGESFSYDCNSLEIISTNDSFTYNGRQDSLDIANRFINNYHKKPSGIEVHLQAYLMQNFDKSPIKELLFDKDLPVWIGNEVSCGVGMQRIDVMTIQEDTSKIYVNVIELKCGEAYSNIVDKQLVWYIEWLNDYIVDTFDKDVIIQPIVLTYETTGIEKGSIVKVTTLRKNAKLLPVRNIFFKIDNKDIVFSEL